MDTSRLHCRWFWLVAVAWLLLSLPHSDGHALADEIDDLFANPPVAARPWVIWHWVHGCVSLEGITADLDAMQQVGIGGAYLMTIKPPLDDSPWPRPIRALSPEWEEAVRHAVREANARGIQIAMHACDGFATAGGPWITPELSMQQVVWTELQVESGQEKPLALPQPQINQDYYRDIVVLAFPAQPGAGRTSRSTPPTVMTSTGRDASFVANPTSDRRVRMDRAGWIQYEFAEPFTCRTVTIKPDGNNYQAQRLAIEASDDGREFRRIAQLAAPRHGWHNGDGTVTHSIPVTTARFFRFNWDKEGSEPGAEDLDAAKWSPVLKVQAIELAEAASIHHFRGKSGAMWRASPRTTAELVPDVQCVPVDSIVDLTEKLNADGRLDWTPPPGRWTVLRFGHTSTGAVNSTGGAAKGLECDKFNAAAVELQFEKWFQHAREIVGPELAEQTLRTLFLDSWECGSQNWTDDLPDAFAEMHGYDALPYLPTLAGVPVASADVSERFLYDYRTTLAALLQERFFDTLTRLAHEQGCEVVAECTAPVMLGHGMRHFAGVDVPMGEFWLKSPTHDKPNDMLDAVSAAHVYGKPIVQAEAFTQLRIQWDEHPGMLKPLADREFARGVNRLAFHVFVQNPWLDRKPGMTLSNIGLLFQRGQSWWPAAKPWVDYLSRCQALLQWGRPVVDIAVFAGEEVPSRAVPPHYLVDKLPGLIPRTSILAEQRRRENRGVPLREQPPGVRHAANIVDPDLWVDPLGGYKYDSIDRHALLELATVKDGRIELPGGASYAALVLPGTTPLQPNGRRMSVVLARKLFKLVEAGATIVLCERPTQSLGLAEQGKGDERLAELVNKLWAAELELASADATKLVANVGKGRVVYGPITDDIERELDLQPDCFTEVIRSGRGDGGGSLPTIAWNHRSRNDTDVYSIANLENLRRQVYIVLRCSADSAAILRPASGRGRAVPKYESSDASRTMNEAYWPNGDRTVFSLTLAPYESVFLVVRRTAERDSDAEPPIAALANSPPRKRRLGPWSVSFQPISGAEFAANLDGLRNLSQEGNPQIRHFTGTAVYETIFDMVDSADRSPVWLDLGQAASIAEVTLNGQPCGVVWTPPFRVELTPHLRAGENKLQIAVTNTWRNRLIGEERGDVPQTSWTTADLPAADAALVPAGLLGPVEIVVEP